MGKSQDVFHGQVNPQAVPRQRFLLELACTVIALGFLVSGVSGQSRLLKVGGDSDGDLCGSAVSGAGDVNTDGYHDFIVGCPGDDANGNASGTARVYSGNDGRILFTVSGASAQDLLGSAVASAGEINSDGHDDFLIGSPGVDSATGANSGRVSVHSGMTGAVLFTWYGDSAQDFFGDSLAGANDVNADGVPDIVIGACADDSSGANSGSVYVFSGADGSQIFKFTGDSANDCLGLSVDGAHDVNGDGYGDIVVGAPYDDGAGTARVFSGFDGATLFVFHGDAPGDQFGYSVSGVGDVDSDGYDDVIVGAPSSSVTRFRSGSAYVYSGLSGTRIYTFHGDGPDHFLGWSVSGAGDVDIDGAADMIVGAYLDEISRQLPSAGTAQVFSGRDGALLFVTSGDQVLSDFGFSVAAAGDVNADGLPDLIVGAPEDDMNWIRDGSATVISPCPLPPATYCTAKLNSEGCLPKIGSSGSATFSGDDHFALTATELINQQASVLFLSPQMDLIPFHGGSLCVGAPIQRTRPGRTGGDSIGTNCSGSRIFHVSHDMMSSWGFGPGETVHAQFLYHDPGFAPPNDVGLTDAILFTVCP